jgi:hypothetical protein
MAADTASGSANNAAVYIASVSKPAAVKSFHFATTQGEGSEAVREGDSPLSIKAAVAAAAVAAEDSKAAADAQAAADQKDTGDKKGSAATAAVTTAGVQGKNSIKPAVGDVEAPMQPKAAQPMFTKLALSPRQVEEARKVRAQMASAAKADDEAALPLTSTKKSKSGGAAMPAAVSTAAVPTSRPTATLAKVPAALEADDLEVEPEEEQQEEVQEEQEVEAAQDDGDDGDDDEDKKKKKKVANKSPVKPAAADEGREANESQAEASQDDGDDDDEDKRKKKVANKSPAKPAADASQDDGDDDDEDKRKKKVANKSPAKPTADASQDDGDDDDEDKRKKKVANKSPAKPTADASQDDGDDDDEDKRKKKVANKSPAKPQADESQAEASQDDGDDDDDDDEDKKKKKKKMVKKSDDSEDSLEPIAEADDSEDALAEIAQADGKPDADTAAVDKDAPRDPFFNVVGRPKSNGLAGLFGIVRPASVQPRHAAPRSPRRARISRHARKARTSAKGPRNLNPDMPQVGAVPSSQPDMPTAAGMGHPKSENFVAIASVPAKVDLSNVNTNGEAKAGQPFFFSTKEAGTRSDAAASNHQPGSSSSRMGIQEVPVEVVRSAARKIRRMLAL